MSSIYSFFQNLPVYLKTYPWFMNLALWFIFGLCMGSFGNVLIYRIPRKKSVIWQRSFCPKCKRNIPFYHNIPILSYLWLKGKCRFCGSSISIQYPLVELSASFLFLLSFLLWGVSITTVKMSFFYFFLLIIALIDYQRFLIPISLSFWGMVMGVVFSLFIPEQISPGQSLWGILISVGTLYIFSDFFYLITGKIGLGSGDISLAGMVGAYLGWKNSLLTLFIASCSALLFVGLYLGIKIISRKPINYQYSWRDGPPRWKKLPLGVFISIGALMLTVLEKFIPDFQF